LRARYAACRQASEQNRAFLLPTVAEHPTQEHDFVEPAVSVPFSRRSLSAARRQAEGNIPDHHGGRHLEEPIGRLSTNALQARERRAMLCEPVHTQS